MRKSLLNAVRFTKFCLEWNVAPEDLARLIVLAETARREMERGGTKNPTAVKVRDHAARMGFTVFWYGLMPTLSRGGKEFHLPTV